MKVFEINYSVKRYGVISLDTAEDKEDAEYQAIGLIKELEDVETADIEIEEIKEIGE